MGTGRGKVLVFLQTAPFVRYIFVNKYNISKQVYDIAIDKYKNYKK
jgi:hypothetical protein